jgi:prepilin-type N-terminal cleavage/methylation domain-containing protein
MEQDIKKFAGFTLTELLLVVVVMGILAGFAIPNYTRSIRRARARDAINNLTAIHAAQVIFKSLNGTFQICNNVTDINNINGAGSLNVIESGATYTCTGADPGTVCTAVSVPVGDFSVTVTLASAISPGTNPACSGNCP